MGNGETMASDFCRKNPNHFFCNKQRGPASSGGKIVHTFSGRGSVPVSKPCCASCAAGLPCEGGHKHGRGEEEFPLTLAVIGAAFAWWWLTKAPEPKSGG